MQVSSTGQAGQPSNPKAQDFDAALGAQNMPSLRVSSPKTNAVRNDVLSTNRLQFLSSPGVAMHLQPSIKGDTFEIAVNTYLPTDVPLALDKKDVIVGNSYLSPKPSHHNPAHITLEPAKGTELSYGYDKRREFYIVRADPLPEKDAEFAQGKLTYVEPDNVPDLVNTWEPEGFDKQG